jgi:hypothetical protein
MKKQILFAVLVISQLAWGSSLVENPDLTLLYTSILPAVQMGPDLRVFDTSCFIRKPDINGRSRRVDFHGGPVSFGQMFGCVVSFSANKKRVVLKSELRGPGSMVSNSHPKADSVTYSEDGQSVFAELNIDSRKENSGYWWSLDTQDPRGNYEMRIWLEGFLLEEIRVVSPQ